MDDTHDIFVDYYHKYKNGIFNYLIYRLHFDNELAEDLMMDIFTKAYETFERFDPKKGSFKSWIFTIAHNHLINSWKQLSKKMLSLETLMEKGIEPAALESNELEKDIEKQKIQKVLLLMPESESDLITLKYVHDFSNEEIVGILGKRDNAVRTALSRSISNFSKLYQKLYPNSDNL